MKRIMFMLIMTVIPLSLNSMSLEQFCTLPIKPPFQSFDPMMGAGYWESGIIKRWFSYLPYENPPKGRWLGNGDGTARLLHALFTSVLNRDDIDISDNPSYVAKHLQPSTIGTIIASLETAQKQNRSLTSELLEKIIVKETGFVHSLESTALEKSHLIGTISSSSLNRYDTNRLFRDLQRKEKIETHEQELQRLNQLKGLARKRADGQIESLKKMIAQLNKQPDTGDYNRIREFVDAMLAAQQPSSLVPSWSLHAILFAFLYRKIKTKFDLDSYIIEVEKVIGEPIIEIKMPTPIPLALIKNQLLQLQSHSTNAKQLLFSLYKPTVYAQILTRYFQGAYPKKAEYTSLYFGRYNFSDCVETVIRNLCNRLLYQKESGTFETTKAPMPRIDPSLISFYEQHKIALSVEDQQCSDDWLTVVENRPWITYRRILQINKDKSCITLMAPRDTAGYIKGIPAGTQKTEERDGIRIKLGNFWYMLIDDPSCELYEMEPSLHNIIIMLDQLFNLKIFQQPIEQEFLRPDFIAHYLPILGQHIPWLSTISSKPSLLATLDATEYAETIREIDFDGFTLYLARDDADIAMNSSTNSLVDLAPQLLTLLNTIHPNEGQFQQLINLLALFPFSPSHLSTELISLLLFWFDLQDQAVIYQLFKHEFRVNKLCNLPTDRCETIISIAAKIIENIPRRFDWRYHTKIMAIIDPWLMQQQPIRTVFDELVTVAQSRMQGSEAEQEELINFFEALIRFPEYRPVISQIMPWFMRHGSERDQKIVHQMMQSYIA